ncbi:MAG: hypothetical protein RLY14_357 [Planctomycetota bacterium]|jgi:hypothetical protein
MELSGKRRSLQAEYPSCKAVFSHFCTRPQDSPNVFRYPSIGVVQELDAHGWPTKQWITKKGITKGLQRADFLSGLQEQLALEIDKTSGIFTYFSSLQLAH